MVPSWGTCWFPRCFLVDGTSTRNLNETKTHFQRSSLWLTGRDITLHLNSYLISCAFMFDIVYGYVLYTWCLVSCVVHLISHNLCFIVGMYISLISRSMYLISNDISYHLFYLFFSLQPLSLSHLTLSKCESCLPKNLRRSIVRLSTHVILAAFPCARREILGIPAFHPASWAPAAPFTHLKRPFFWVPSSQNSIIRGPLCMETVRYLFCAQSPWICLEFE